MSKKSQIFEYKDDINGRVPVIFQWSFDFNFLVCGGDKSVIYVLDKRGKRLKDIQLPTNNKLLQLEWDKDGEYVCIVQDGLNHVNLWAPFTNNSQVIQVELDNPKAKVSYAKWSKSHGILAIGSDKGGLLFYTKKQAKKLPTMGKHSKKIISGDWNNEGYLITSGEDKFLTVSNYNSETMFESIPVKAEAKNVVWSRSKTDSREQNQRTVTAIIQQKTIIMFELGKNHKMPDELMFENKYGKIVDYTIFGDGYLVIGFSEGYVAHISTHRKEIKDEVQSEKLLKSVDAMCTNDSLYKLAVAGDGCIKMKYQLRKLNYPMIVVVVWSQNGQILVVSTEKGCLFGFQTSIPTLTASYASMIALQQSFTEISIYSTQEQSLNEISTVTLENEPNQISMSMQYFAAGLNNVVFYYKYLELKNKKAFKPAIQAIKMDYLGYVNQIILNDESAAILSNNVCTFHKIEQTGEYVKQQFPDNDQEKPILHIGLTKNFLFLLDSQSKIRVYNVFEKQFIIEFKNDYSLTKIFPNISGTRSICINNKGQGFLFEASLELLTKISEFPEKTERIIWDQKDPNLFVTQVANDLTTYIVNKNNLQQEMVHPVLEYLSMEDLQKSSPPNPSVTEIEKGVQALSLTNGTLKCFTMSRNVMGQPLISHSYLKSYKGADDNNEGHFRYFLQNLALFKFANAHKAALNLKNLKLFDTFGRKCLENLEFDVAQKAFQAANNISMVMMIQSFKNETEKNLLFAYVAMILGQHDLAQDLFLKSSYRLGALELRSDIQDYVNALSLAKKIAPEQEPFICKRLAIQIETQGNNPEAVKMYEMAMLNEKLHDSKTVETHNQQCVAGIARCSIKMGDILRGSSLSRQISDPLILQEIALVCENMKFQVEAAELYEQAGCIEKAATIYITQKMFKQAAPLMNKVKSPKLLILYAKAKESEGAFQEAENVYEKAEDWENVVRLNLNQLNNIERAKFILRNKCKTVTLASMVAQYCERRGSKAEAVEFLILAEKKEQAFALAQNYNEMDSYVEHMKAFSLEERLQVAQYFEGKNQLDKAAFHFEKAQDPMKALRLYQKAGEEFINDMIDLVARNKQDSLIQHLSDYINGDTDDIPKDPIFSLKLQKAIGNLQAVGRIAITIAASEQECGKYKEAHQFLYETCDDLKSSGNQIPFDLYQKLMTLHSYTLVKKITKLEEHEDLAKLLDRVCKSISQFPNGATNILTMAVIEATKANFKSMAYQWAITLMKQEYRSQINEKFKTRIENIARKPVKEEVPDKKTPCPFCGEFVSEFTLDCPKCSNNIPFCIASAKHIVAEQCCFCPECKFPANIQYFKRILEIEPICPLCQKQIRSQDLKEVSIMVRPQFQVSKEEVLKLKRKAAVDEKKQ
ncbi:unnamed protein product (macronuclear) [Paramecium tetraurelia]|uniref:Anaphase-promoting complex subunit 4 WD40 domain-containing protein n=1 Tax=Paramecium tetraurelia TaxID=5888 RepID=A0DLU7_PARTE|nr:uncharacterized protein GSPATT00039646001 [Paramecium tetraurelia]CAK84014.1 unnamed protein product [Paramecium tetraurelia]|eukprot:XP_001451411.1 hypothetical protein (macronuclear) [Paramecium tetraurelia strain d4-2]